MVLARLAGLVLTEPDLDTALVAVPRVDALDGEVVAVAGKPPV